RADHSRFSPLSCPQAPSRPVFSSIEEHCGRDEMPSLSLKPDVYSIADCTFHSLIHIGILAKNVSGATSTPLFLSKTLKNRSRYHQKDTSMPYWERDRGSPRCFQMKLAL